MKNNMMLRNLCQSILHPIGRYVAIAVIIALGSGMFVGLRSTRNDMVETGQIYMDHQNMFDLRLLTSYGWSKDQLKDIQSIDGIGDAEGVFYTDLIVTNAKNGDDSVYRFYTIPEKINMLSLRSGRMPEKNNECLADGFRNREHVLGTQITISDTNDEETLESVKVKTFTIVGIVGTPLYMDMNRGNTSVGNGNIANYFFVPDDALDADYYTEIHVTIPGNHRIYTDEYNDAMSDAADWLEPQMQLLADERLISVRSEAMEKYEDGLREYNDGLSEYLEAKEKADQELHDAYQELLEGKEKLRKSEEELKRGEEQIANAKYEIYQNNVALFRAKKELKSKKTSTYSQIEEANKALSDQYQLAKENLVPIEQAIAELNVYLNPLNDSISQLEGSIAQLNGQIQNINGQISSANARIDELRNNFEEAETNEAEISQLEQQISELNSQKSELESQKTGIQSSLQGLYDQRTPLADQKAELDSARSTVLNGLSQIEAGIAQLNSQKATADKEFAEAEAQIKDGESQLQKAGDQVAWLENEIKNGWKELEQGKEDWEEGCAEYKNAKADAEKELSDAEEELKDAEAKLADAKETIDDMDQNDLFILNRNSNMGYSSLDSSSNIVAGVSKVFPAFFLLVAALVCITTMTRMVDDERTQIGIMKALGYSNLAIVSKYLIYSGSSALMGCTAGVVLGSIIFPIVLWEAYKIMLYITPSITLCFDWKLCGIVIISYTTVMLLVTWYCCRKELKDVPAELIRPKAPESGKKLVLEKTAVWNKLSFLNKVAVRNIFRYRQRLAMMMLGIGGCTALLLTGFGIRDSIMNIVDIQFEEVTKYDIETYFQSGLSAEEQQEFCQKLNGYTDQILFYSQSSTELIANNQSRNISLIISTDEITDFISFHKGSTSLDFPETDEVMLSSGMADMLGLHIGEEIILRNPDLETLKLKIAGIYDNHVNNYAIVSTETAEKQWGRMPEQQMAYITVPAETDAYEVGAYINSQNHVMNVTVNKELAKTVNKMMEALDLIVLVVVFCAGLLAAIVLYNLTNINITERIREIATIKVLGFNAYETAMYVFKENLALSVFGSLFGIILGKLLLSFVINQIKIDMIWLEPRLLPFSYFISLLLTLLMGIIVDLVFYFRLEKINMAEALKSVE